MANESTRNLSVEHDGEALAIASLIGAATIWGTATIGTKTALESIPPFLLTELRWILAFSALFTMLWLRGKRPLLNRHTFILAILGIATFNFFFNFGLQRTSAANGSLISGALPVVIAIMSFFLLKERLPPIAWVGVCLSIVGIAVTLSGRTLDTSPLGNGLMIGSVFVWAGYSIYSRLHVRGEDAMTVTAGTAVFGLLLLIPLSLWEVVNDPMPDPTWKLTGIVLFLGLGPSLMGILFWSFGLTRVPASRAGVFSNLTPIVGIISAGLILGEPITRYHIIGGAMVLGGVLLTTLTRRS